MELYKQPINDKIFSMALRIRKPEMQEDSLIHLEEQSLIKISITFMIKTARNLKFMNPLEKWCSIFSQDTTPQ